jgi:hypothetical protein
MVIHTFGTARSAMITVTYWHLERSSSSHPVLAGVYASPLPGTEDFGRTCALDPSLDPGVAVPPPAEGELLEYPYVGDVVGRRSFACFATAEGQDTPSCG